MCLLCVRGDCAGPVENIKSLNRADLRDYIDTHYTSKRFVIAGAGAINHNQLVCSLHVCLCCVCVVFGHFIYVCVMCVSTGGLNRKIFWQTVATTVTHIPLQCQFRRCSVHR
jgi:hypothetical protein